MSLWTLTITRAGESLGTRSAQGWGIDADSLRFSFNSWLADVCEFSMSEADGLVDDAFEYRDAVTIYKDGVKWFVGRIYKPKSAAISPQELQSYIVKNVWQDLETLVLEQDRNTKIEADGFTAFHRVPLTRAVLTARLTDGVGIEKVTTKEGITDILAYAVAEGLELAYNVDFASYKVPFEEGNNLTAAAAMRKLAAYTPDAATKVDYSTTPYPTVYIRRRATETPVTLDLLDSGTTGLTGWPNIDADHELVPAGVEISLQTGVTNPADDLRYALINRQSATIVGGAVFADTFAAGPDRARMIRATFSLVADGTIDAEADLPTLAADIAAAFKELFWNAELNFKAREVPGTYRPGKLINFSNGKTPWATAKAIVQSVSELPAKGETVVRCGRPPWLAKGTLDEINRRLAQVQNPTNAVANYYPGYTQNKDADDVFGDRDLEFNLSGWTYPGTEVVGSATFRIKILGRTLCNITLTSFSITWVVAGTSHGLASWHTYDAATLALVPPEQYTGSGTIAGNDSAKLGHPTGTFKVLFTVAGPAGAEGAVFTVSVPATGTAETLKVSLNCEAD